MGIVSTIVSSHCIVGGPASYEGSPANTGVRVVEESKGPSVVCGKNYLKCISLSMIRKGNIFSKLQLRVQLKLINTN